MDLVHKQIEQALDKMGSSSLKNQEKSKTVLKRYVDGEIGLDEAYYELLDGELIPMPQRCGMTSKIPPTPEDEIRLKDMIKSKLAL